MHLAPDVEKKLHDLAAQSGRGTDWLLQDALAGYLDELAQVRDMLNSRYDDLKSGRIKPISRDEWLTTSAKRAPPTGDGLYSCQRGA
jgi:predicted transcriptional regulator